MNRWMSSRQGGKGMLLGAQPETGLEFILEFGWKGEVTRRLEDDDSEGVAYVKWVRADYLSGPYSSMYLIAFHVEGQDGSLLTS